MTQPLSGFPYYISLAGDENLTALFQSATNRQLLFSISEEKACYRYAQGKWSIKQVLGHITDHERIMTYRALRFSRKDETVLAGYDQDSYVEQSAFDHNTYQDLLNDYKAVRQATLTFIKLLKPEQMELKGTAWKYELTVADTLKATIGHEFHHMNILKERYLI